MFIPLNTQSRDTYENPSSPLKTHLSSHRICVYSSRIKYWESLPKYMLYIGQLAIPLIANNENLSCSSVCL
jgi:hypothetical protein